MGRSQFVAALNPENRRSLRFYFVTLWAYVSAAAVIACMVLPLVTPHFTTAVSDRAINRGSLALAFVLELIWFGYAAAVFSWRLSGYLYQKSAEWMRSSFERVQSAAEKYLPKAS